MKRNRSNPPIRPDANGWDAAPRPAGGARRALWRLVPTSLRGRLALTYVVVVVAVMLALGFYLSVAARELYVDRLTTQLRDQAHLIGDLVAPAMAAGDAAAIDTIAKRLGGQLAARITVIAPDGTVLGESTTDPRRMENLRSRPEVVAAQRDGVGVAARQSGTLDQAYLYVALRVPAAAGGVVRLGVPSAEVDAAVWPMLRGFRIATLIAAVLVAAVGIGVAGRITRPLDDLRRQATAVAAGRLDVRVEPAGIRELGELGRAFNMMTQRLRASLTEADRARTRLEVTLSNLSDGVVITDDRGAVIRINAAAARMLGTTEASHDQPFVQVGRDHELAALLRDALEGGGSGRTAIVEHGRTRRILEATAQRLDGAAERLGLIVLRDVTELRRLEGVRREFVANVSHELRTPLASIRALVETLEVGAIDEPTVAADFLRRIVAEVDRLAALVDELLDLARLESGRTTLNLEALDPINLVGRAVDRLRPQIERAHLTLNLTVPAQLPAVRADRARFEQIMLNLVHNAIKFTPAGGTITVLASAADGMLVVTIRDTGVGVPPEELPRLFERFYKTDRARRSEGTGLGLAITKHIVQAHGGTIWVDSTFGAGADFSFTLPLAVPPPSAPADSDRAAAAIDPGVLTTST